MLDSVSEVEDVMREALLGVHQALDVGEQIGSPHSPAHQLAAAPASAQRRQLCAYPTSRPARSTSFFAFPSQANDRINAKSSHMSTARTQSKALTTLSAITHRYMTANGVRLHVAEAGASGPPVLLLHGYPQHWYAWRHVIADLARDHRVYALDLRGAGQSDAPRRAGRGRRRGGRRPGLR